MRYKLLNFFQTLIILVGLIVQTMPPHVFAVAHDEDPLSHTPEVANIEDDHMAISDEADAEEPISTQILDSSTANSGRFQPLDSPQCGLNYFVALYDPASAPDLSTLAPDDRFIEQFVLAETPLFPEARAFDEVLPGAAPPPPFTVNPWDVSTPDPSDRKFRPDNATAAADPNLWYTDLRTDVNANNTAIRGRDVQVLILVRNSSASTNCQLPVQTMIFDEIQVRLDDSQTLSGPLGSSLVNFVAESEDFVSFYDSSNPGTPFATPQALETNPSPLGEHLIYPKNIGPGTGPGTQFTDAFYLSPPVTIPTNAVDYLRVTLGPARYSCTFNPPGETYCNNLRTDAALGAFNYYVLPIGGPLVNISVDVPGGQNDRQVGEEAWFLLTVDNLPAGETIASISNAIGSTIPECGNTTAPSGAQGWYQDDPLLDTVNDTGPTVPISDRMTYDGSGGPGNDVQNMNVATGDQVYCAFSRNLFPTGDNIFTLTGALEVFSDPLTLNISEVFPLPNTIINLGQSGIEVEKTIIPPLDNNGDPKTVVETGDILVYQITIRNVGDVDLERVSYVDSITGAFAFPLTQVLAPGEEVTNTIQYVVQLTDPTPLQNTVEARAIVSGTSFEVTDIDIASILKAASELQLILTTAPAPVGTGGPGFQPGENVIFQLEYCNNGQQNLNSVNFVSGFPAVRNQSGDPLNNPEPGTIEFSLPNYFIDSPTNPGQPQFQGTVETYSVPPVIMDPLIQSTPPGGAVVNPPFFPAGGVGCYGPIEWAYTIPDPGPTGQNLVDPILQQIRMRAVREDGSTIFAEAELFVELTNNNVQIDAQLWDPNLNQPRTQNTVLRGEELMFDLSVINLSPIARCDAIVRQYQINPDTGAQTIIASDLLLNWSSGVEGELTATGTPGDNATTTITNPSDPVNLFRPTYQVPTTNVPDSIAIVFEVDATSDCSSSPLDPNFIDRVTLLFDVSDVQISTSMTLSAEDTTSPTGWVPASEGIYPDSNSFNYRIEYTATNVGPTTLTIQDWSYCISNSPNPAERCSPPSFGLSMYDGDNQGDISGAGIYPDFGVVENAPADDPTRQFTTLETRSDSRIFTLNQGQNYPNPLIVQVIIQGVDNRGNTVLIREAVVFPLITGQLRFEVLSPGTVVFGDRNVEVDFTFANSPDNGDITNVRVLNLIVADPANSGPPASEQMPPNIGFGPEFYERCEHDIPTNPSVPSVIDLIQGTDTLTRRGTCRFDFTENIPQTGNVIEFQAAVLADQGGSTIFDIATGTIEILPHLTATKDGVGSVLASDNIPYTITIRNNSRTQEAYFNPIDGFTDVFSPGLPGSVQYCYPNETTCFNFPPTLNNFTSPALSAGGPLGLILNPGDESDLTYFVTPPISGSHAAAQYNNTATFVGEGRFSQREIQAQASHEVSVQCPLVWSAQLVPSHPDHTDTDLISTVGEVVRVRVRATNLGKNPINFFFLEDDRFQLENGRELDDGIGGGASDVDWQGGTPGVLAGADPVSGALDSLQYEVTTRIRPTDFRDGGPITGNTSIESPITFDTDLLADPPCSRSDPGVDEFLFWFLPITNPVQIVKTASPVFAFAGQTVDYSISMFNYSETTEMQVDSVIDSLDYDLITITPGSPLQIQFPGSPPTIGTNGILPVYTPPSPSNPNPPLRLAVNNDPLTYTVQPSDPEEIENVATVEYRVSQDTANGPTWLNSAGERDAVLRNADIATIVTNNPLQIQKLIVAPTDGVAPRGTVVTYQIVVTNANLIYDMEDVSVTDSLIPICGSPGAPLPPACLEDTTGGFRLTAGASRDFIVEYTVPNDAQGPTLVNTAIANGLLNVGGTLVAMPEVTANATITVSPPILTVQPRIYNDPACSVLRVDVPQFDRNDDDIPEASVGDTVYYGFDIFVGGGKTYTDIQLTNNLNSLDARLTNDANDALRTATGTAPGDPVTIADDITTPVTPGAPEVPEVAICVPYIIPSAEPDPLELTSEIIGIDTDTLDLSTFTSTVTPLDIGNRNIFISKSVQPIVAFPGQTVTYTIEIQNNSGFAMEINDVWDDRLGGQIFQDIGGVEVPGDYQDDPTTTSIPFDSPLRVNPTDVGWDWPDTNNIGILQPGEALEYVYTQTVNITDPDPLINRAGVLATVVIPPGSGTCTDPTPCSLDVSDQTLNSLAVTPSQLRVTKTASPTATLLGQRVTYDIAILNIGSTPVFDIVIWDDRYNLEFPGYNQMLRNDPANGGNLGPGILSWLGGTDINGVGGPNDLRPAGQPGGEPIVVRYTLPTEPACVQWSSGDVAPWTPTDPVNGVNTGVCDAYEGLQDLTFIDPFINSAFAIGLIDNGGTLEYLDAPGSDTAIVDLVNPGIRVEKIPSVGGASVGSDVLYTIRVENTGDGPIRIDDVIDVPDANIPNSPTISTQLPIRQLTFEDCPVDGFGTDDPNVTNLQGTTLIPFSFNGDSNQVTIAVDDTAILPPDCSVVADITVQVRNPFPNDQYVNVVQVNAWDIQSSSRIGDLNSAAIDIRSSGIEIIKRAWSCDTASNGVNTPLPILPPDPNATDDPLGARRCTVNTPLPGAQLLVAQDQGRSVYYEISLINSGTDSFDRLMLQDVIMVDNGVSLVPGNSLVDPSQEWVGPNGQVYSWTSSGLEIQDLTPGVIGDGPFGPDDPGTPLDESNWFEPGEEFARPDPGTVEIPVITYRHVVTLPRDDPDDDLRYINRATVTAFGDNAPVPQSPINNSADYTLQIRPAELSITMEACVNVSGFDPLTFGPDCVTVARPGQDVWYRLTITNQAEVPMENFDVVDLVRGVIPTNPQDTCWSFGGIDTWQGVPDFLSPGESATCTYLREDPPFAPLTIGDDPLENEATVNFLINTGGTPTPGNPSQSNLTTIRVAESELLLTVGRINQAGDLVPECDGTLTAPGGTTRIFNLVAQNISTTDPITNVDIFAPDPATGTPTSVFTGTIPADGFVNIPSGLQVEIPTFGPPTNTYTVTGFGTILGLPVTASTDCTIQRVDGSLQLTKTGSVTASTSGTPIGSNVAQPGDTITYTITVENLDTFSATIDNLVVSDPQLEAVVAPVDWDWPTELSAGQSVSRTFDYVVPTGVDPIENTATATGTIGISDVNNSDTVTINVAEGDLVAQATASPSIVLAGESINFQYEVCNLSDTVTYSLQEFSDNDPSGQPVTTAQGNPFQVDRDLAPLSCARYQRVVPTTDADAGTTIERNLFVSGCDRGIDPGCTTLITDSQNAAVDVVDANVPLLVNFAVEPDAVVSGQTIQFTLTVTNISGNQVRLDDVSDVATGLNIFNNPAGLQGATLQPNGSRTLVATYPFTGAPDPLIQTLDINYTDLVTGLTGSVSESVTVPVVSVAGSQLLIEINTAAQTAPGANLVFTYRVTNIGGETINDAYIETDAPIPPPGCSTFTPTSWAAGGTGNLIPSMPIGFTRTATATCAVDATFPVSTDLTHTARVNRTSITPDPLQDTDTATVTVVPPLALTVAPLSNGVPGGFLTFQYTVENIGPTVVNRAVLAPTIPPECEAGSWQTNPDNTDTGADLWTAGGQTIPLGGSVVATAGCTIPQTFLDGPPSMLEATFPHNVDVTIDGNTLDSATTTARVVQPLEFTWFPQNTPALTTTPTVGAGTPFPTFLRANDTTNLVFRLRNIGPPGFTVENVEYNLSFFNATGSGSTLSCSNLTVQTSWGGQYAGDLPNSGDYINVTCAFSPTTADAQQGSTKGLDMTVSHEVGGIRVPITIPSPLMSAVVEDVSLEVELYDPNPISRNAGETRADDGETIIYSLVIRNTGTVPLGNFTFAQGIFDPVTNVQVPGSQDVLTSGVPVHTLNDLWLANRDPNGARCPTALQPGEVCEITGVLASHQISTTSLQNTIDSGDPTEHNVSVLVEAASTTGSNLTVAQIARWPTIVERPIVELGGEGPAMSINDTGNVWMFNPAFLTITPNPAVQDGEVTFNMTVRNAGYKDFVNPRLNVVITSPIASNNLGALSGNNQVLPATVEFTMPERMTPGEIENVTATWTVTDIIAPTTVTVQFNFLSEVDGGYPPYNVLSNAIPLLIVPDPAAVTTDPDGNPLDPNATEPLITITPSVDSAFPGDEVLWTINITNPSTQEMANVNLVNAVPGDLVVNAAQTTRGASTVTGNLIEVSTGALAPGDRVTVTVSTTVSDTAQVPSLLTNIACGIRQGSATEVCAEGILGIGQDAIANPDTGIGTVPPGMAENLPFVLVIVGMFFFMLLLSVNLSDRQRMMLVALAAGVVLVIIVGVLLLGSGSESEGPSDADGSPPPEDVALLTTATPLPSATPVGPTPTLTPTYPPDALATLQSFPPTATPYILPTQAGPRRLEIPRLSYSIPVPIVELPFINREWDVSNLGHNIGWLDGTTWFDSGWGNTVLVGHVQLGNNDPGPFRELEALEAGDEILVYEGNIVRTFEVTESFLVGPAEVDVLGPTVEPVLTLMTCTNWDQDRGVFSDRYVVRAIPVTEVASE